MVTGLLVVYLAGLCPGSTSSVKAVWQTQFRTRARDATSRKRLAAARRPHIVDTKLLVDGCIWAAVGQFVYRLEVLRLF